MTRAKRILSSILAFSAALAIALLPAAAGSHSWAPYEIYSNADGTIQYIEFYNPTGANETGIATRFAQAEAQGNVSAPFGYNLPAGSTTDKYLLVATQGFMDLPGAPTPDLAVPLIDNFIDIDGDTIRFWTYTFSWSTLVFGAGQLPIGGDDSLNSLYNNPAVFTSVATPTNFAGETFPPPGVAASGTQLRLGKLPGFPGADRIQLEWDDAGCFGATKFQILHGFGSQLPSSPGAAFSVEPASALQQCNIQSSPKIWSGVPDPSSDPSRLLWILMLANDDQNTEGSWGKDGGGLERVGPGVGGASMQCGNMTKSLVNTCGH